MATLVYIHGESYEWNSGNLYDGTVLAAHSNIIVVTINFRLGVLGGSECASKNFVSTSFIIRSSTFMMMKSYSLNEILFENTFSLKWSLFEGFLKTGTKGSAQGNFGLMDLVAGLHWLRENLPAFNGNPNMLTLMGHGK